MEVILDLSQENESIRVTDLAEKLGVAKSSVNQAVSKLVDLNLLSHERYGPMQLTEQGKVQARKIQRRHEVLKHFFSEILGVDHQTAEQDACSVEHYISPITMDKLVDYLSGLIQSR